MAMRRRLVGIMIVSCAMAFSSCGAKTGLKPWPYCESCERPRKDFACVCPEDFGLPKVDRVPECAGIGDRCVGRFAPVARDLPNLLILLDKSSSALAADEGETIWNMTREAIDAVLDPYKHVVNVGMELFPSLLVEPIPLQAGTTSPSCYTSPMVDIPIGDGVSKAQEISDRLSRIRPAGGTPTAAALNNAYRYFDEGAGASLLGPRLVLLVTDGGPNCNAAISCTPARCTEREPCAVACCAENNEACLDDARAIAAIEALAEIGVDVVVMGLGDSDVYASVLNDFAVAGGRPLDGPVRYHQVPRSEGLDVLVDALASVLGSIADPCNFELSAVPPGQVNLVVDCEAVPQSGGWTLEGSPPSVSISGPLCERIRAGTASLDVLLGCPTVE